MSKLDAVTPVSMSLKLRQMFADDQTIGATTTLQALPTDWSVPVAVEGDTDVNPIGVWSNHPTRATSLILMFGLTGDAAATLVFDVIGHSKIAGTDFYMRAKLYHGTAVAGTTDIGAVGLMGAGSKLCDNFGVAAFSSPFATESEPDDNTTAAMLVVDVRGFEYVTVRLAASAATAAQVWFGEN